MSSATRSEFLLERKEKRHHLTSSKRKLKRRKKFSLFYFQILLRINMISPETTRKARYFGAPVTLDSPTKSSKKCINKKWIAKAITHNRKTTRKLSPCSLKSGTTQMRKERMASPWPKPSRIELATTETRLKTSLHWLPPIMLLWWDIQKFQDNRTKAKSYLNTIKVLRTRRWLSS